MNVVCAHASLTAPLKKYFAVCFAVTPAGNWTYPRKSIEPTVNVQPVGMLRRRLTLHFFDDSATATPGPEDATNESKMSVKDCLSWENDDPTDPGGHPVPSYERT